MVSKVTGKIGGKKAGKTKAVSEGKKKKGGKRKESFNVYVCKVMKHLHRDISISFKAMDILNSFVNDIFERITREASLLAHYNKISTISSREIQTATRLLLSSELAKHAVTEGVKAIGKYTSCKCSHSVSHPKYNGSFSSHQISLKSLLTRLLIFPVQTCQFVSIWGVCVDVRSEKKF